MSTQPSHSSKPRMRSPALELLLGGAVTASGRGLSLAGCTLDSGGGTCTGGAFTVSGTIGQPDASGPRTGGQFSMTGGFWALPAVIGTNWVLQERLKLSSGDWTNSPSAWTTPIVVPATLAAKFFRLFKP